MCWNIYHNSGDSEVDSSFRRELRLHPPDPSSWSRWEWRCLKTGGGNWRKTIRPPEAIPVPNADHPDTPSLSRFVEGCLHLLTHSTGKFKTLPHSSPCGLIEKSQGRFLVEDSRPQQPLTFPRRKDLTPSLQNCGSSSIART